jgi:hypothetical protein
MVLVEYELMSAKTVSRTFFSSNISNTCIPIFHQKKRKTDNLIFLAQQPEYDGGMRGIQIINTLSSTMTLRKFYFHETKTN